MDPIFVKQYGINTEPLKNRRCLLISAEPSIGKQSPLGKLEDSLRLNENPLFYLWLFADDEVHPSDDFPLKIYQTSNQATVTNLRKGTNRHQVMENFVRQINKVVDKNLRFLLVADGENYDHFRSLYRPSSRPNRRFIFVVRSSQLSDPEMQNLLNEIAFDLALTDQELYFHWDNIDRVKNGCILKHTRLGIPPHKVADVKGSCSAQSLGLIEWPLKASNLFTCSKVIFVDFRNVRSFFQMFFDTLAKTLNFQVVGNKLDHRKDNFLSRALAVTKTFVYAFDGSVKYSSFKRTNYYKSMKPYVDVCQKDGYFHLHQQSAVDESQDFSLLFTLSRLHAVLSTNVPFFILSDNGGYLSTEQVFRTLNSRRKVIWMPCLDSNIDNDSLTDNQMAACLENRADFQVFLAKLLEVGTKGDLVKFQYEIQENLVKKNFPKMKDIINE